MKPTWNEKETQRLINAERKKRHIPPVEWDSYMHELSRNHSEAMAKARRLYHTDRYALQGGENCFMGSSSPKAIVRGWMSSTAGHREWLLDRRVNRAAIGISNGGHGRGHHTYVAWSFAEDRAPSISRTKSATPSIPSIRIPPIVRELFQLPGVFHIPTGLRGSLRIPEALRVQSVIVALVCPYAIRRRIKWR